MALLGASYQPPVTQMLLMTDSNELKQQVMTQKGGSTSAPGRVAAGFPSTREHSGWSWQHVASTSAWSYQLGARAQWVGRSAEMIVFNRRGGGSGGDSCGSQLSADEFCSVVGSPPFFWPLCWPRMGPFTPAPSSTTGVLLPNDSLASFASTAVAAMCQQFCRLKTLVIWCTSSHIEGLEIALPIEIDANR